MGRTAEHPNAADGAPTIEQMRAMYRRPKPDDVERLAREIIRLRVIVREAERLRQVIDKIYKEEVGGHLVALHELRLLLQQEARGADSPTPGQSAQAASRRLKREER